MARQTKPGIDRRPDKSIDFCAKKLIDLLVLRTWELGTIGSWLSVFVNLGSLRPSIQATKWQVLRNGLLDCKYKCRV